MSGSEGAATVGQTLERALVDDPDDVAAHAAYADWLAEQGDPRGEFIQTQLALEDPTRPATERRRWQDREQALLAQHNTQWLGDLGRFLVGEWCGQDKPYDYRFDRGWLGSLRVLPFPVAILSALTRAPEARLLRRLEVVYDMRYHPFDFEQFTEAVGEALTEKERAAEGEVYDNTIPPELFTATNLKNLRSFKLGFSDTEEQPAHSTMVQPFNGCEASHILSLLTSCRRLEELYLNTEINGIDQLFAHPALGNLQVLQYYYGSDYSSRETETPYPLSALADNTALRRLASLRLHPGRDATIDLDSFVAILRSPNLPSLTHLQVHTTTFGDEGCDPIVQSGILQRLKCLDLGYGAMTDAGARVLAACPDLKRLETLDVSRNALTESGVAVLKATGTHVIAANQHGPDDEDYLFEVDVE